MSSLRSNKVISYQYTKNTIQQQKKTQIWNFEDIVGAKDYADIYMQNWKELGGFGIKFIFLFAANFKNKSKF